MRTNLECEQTEKTEAGDEVGTFGLDCANVLNVVRDLVCEGIGCVAVGKLELHHAIEGLVSAKRCRQGTIEMVRMDHEERRPVSGRMKRKDNLLLNGAPLLNDIRHQFDGGSLKDCRHRQDQFEGGVDGAAPS